MAIYFSLFTQMQAISLLGIAIPLHLANKQINVNAIGFVMAFYSIGLIVGCLKGKNFIQYVGHIRAFSGFASLAAIIGILHFLIDHIFLTALFRFVTGLSAAVLLIVLESWCLVIAKQSKTTNVLVGYQLTFYSAMATGLLLINLVPTALPHAYFIASLLFCAALIPMALIRINAPEVSLDTISVKELSRISPVGVIGAVTAGSAIGSIYNMVPIFAKGLGITTVDISIFMISIVLSGVLLQHSIDRLSRIVKRQNVLLFLLLALCCNALLVVKLKESLPLPILGIMIGSLIACIYPISLNITSDNYKGNNGVSVSSTMLLFYGIGGVLGPILSGKTMAVFGNEALFYYLVTSILCAVFLILIYQEIGTRQ